MKLLFFVESLRCGGAERSLLSLISNLDENKFDITLLMSNSGGEFEKFIPSYVKVKYVELNINYISRIKYKLRKTFNFKSSHHAQLLWKSSSYCINNYNYDDNEYDVAIAWGQGFATYYTSKKIVAKRKYAWVNIDFELAGYSKKIDRPIYDKFDGVVGVSEFVQQSMQKFLPRNKVHYIKNIIDIDDVVEKAKLPLNTKFDSNKFNVVSIGRLAKQKAFDLAIKSASILKLNDVEFHWYILGEGEERENLERLIYQLNLEKHVTLLGYIENPYPYIKASSIYCQTSLFEGLGRVLIEANHLNKVTISTDFPSAYSLIEDEVNGCIVQMDEKQISDKIIQMVDDNKYLERLELNIINYGMNTKKETLDSFEKLMEL